MSRQRLRQGVAALLAPTMLEGVRLSWDRANEQQIEHPTERYGLLLKTTVACLKVPSTLERSREHYKQDGAIQAAFQNFDTLAAFLEHGAESLINPAVIDRLWVAVSAEGFLAQTDPALSPAEIIPRSTGLLAIAKVRDTAVRALHCELGLPIAPEHFRLDNPAGNSAPTVKFTGEAVKIMKQYPSRMGGCPAHSLPDPSDQAPNLLTAYWQQTTTYAFSGPTPL